jgi:hypothetical protein
MGSVHMRYDAWSYEAACATDKWARPYFIILKIFNHLNFEIQIGDLLDAQNSPNFAGKHFETQETTLLFGPTSKSHMIACYKF